MKRLFFLLLVLLIAVGCSRGQGTTRSTNPSDSKEPQTQATPAPPKEPVLTEEPLWLMAPQAKTLWGGPVAVVVENSPQSRPQVGIQEADLVMEALAESEISRFLAFYGSTPVAKIGPVRSARTGLLAVSEAYGAPFAHAGGNADALAILQSHWGARDLDEITNAGPFFYRSSDRSAPHNLYTSTDLLGQAVTSRKIAMKAAPTTARNVGVPGSTKAGPKVTVNWHRIHQVEWTWQEDRYLRVDDGEPHLLESGQPISAANLLFLSVTGVNNGPDLGWTLDLQKGGKATVLAGGQRWEGSWRLEKGGFRITPASGKVPLLAPGITWVHLITQESSFTIE